MTPETPSSLGRVYSDAQIKLSALGLIDFYIGSEVDVKKDCVILYLSDQMTDDQMEDFETSLSTEGGVSIEHTKTEDGWTVTLMPRTEAQEVTPSHPSVSGEVEVSIKPGLQLHPSDNRPAGALI